VKPKIYKLKHTLEPGLALELNLSAEDCSLAMSCSINVDDVFGSKLKSILARKL
jgi:hypothetical protein